MILGTASQADHAKVSQHGSDRVQHRQAGEIDCRASHMGQPCRTKGLGRVPIGHLSRRVTLLIMLHDQDLRHALNIRKPNE